MLHPGQRSFPGSRATCRAVASEQRRKRPPDKAPSTPDFRRSNSFPITTNTRNSQSRALSELHRFCTISAPKSKVHFITARSAHLTRRLPPQAFADTVTPPSQQRSLIAGRRASLKLHRFCTVSAPKSKMHFPPAAPPWLSAIGYLGSGSPAT